MTTRSLAQLNEGETGLIIKLLAGMTFKKRMTELGFTKNADVKIIRKTIHGPMIIELKCCGRLAIGIGEASKIIVKVGD
ncbi:ferrous iron transport protein A [Candidatus Micrarchaeota archaeon]|nr:ferrous iron transport protein A [Candidatus Micrarchaeota archaeon]MBU1166218.1 ferrous iron transport protein A [Candidatus Micrarchaeota archaeon]MBU1886191.1 ferrous iron transport protein A [Candidatus Micrarchaeota archaeon]